MILDVREALRTTGFVERPNDVWVEGNPVQLMAVTVFRVVQGTRTVQGRYAVKLTQPKQKLDPHWFKRGDELFADRSMQ